MRFRGDFSPMLLRSLPCIALSIFAIAGCTATNRFGDTSNPPMDATNTEVASSCAAGQWECVAGTTTARQCDGVGGFRQTVTCSGICTPGIGCVGCAPNGNRCSPTAPDTVQTCGADGNTWTDGATCDASMGLHCVEGRCVNPCIDLGDSYLGCEYWPTITGNGGLASEFEFAIAFASTQPYPVTVRVDGGRFNMPVVRTVQPNSVEVMRLPWVSELSQNQMQCCPNLPNQGPACAVRSARVQNGAYHVVSDAPIAIYQFNPLEYHLGNRFSFTNDASLLLPQNVLGRQYLAMSYVTEGPPIGLPNDRCLTTALRGGFVSVVGTHTMGTNRVRVTTTGTMWDPRNVMQMLPVGTYTFDLARGEVLQLVAQGLNQDITGTYIDADLPVAVFSGHECAAVPIERPACDHLEEQLFPMQTWGRVYSVSPVKYFNDLEPSVIRVMAQRDGVTLSFDGIAAPPSCARTLMRGQFCEFASGEGFTVTGSAPISVAQYLRGLGDSMECQCAGNTCPDSPRCNGDPSLVLEVPRDQYRTNYRFLTPESYSQSFVNIIAPEGADLDLDGNPVVGAVSIPTGTGWTTRIVSVRPGSHNVRAVDNTTRFGIKVWGIAPYTSYAYPGGLDLRPIAPL